MGTFEKRLLCIILIITAPVWMILYGLAIGTLTAYVATHGLAADLYKMMWVNKDRR